MNEPHGGNGGRAYVKLDEVVDALGYDRAELEAVLDSNLEAGRE